MSPQKNLEHKGLGILLFNLQQQIFMLIKFHRTNIPTLTILYRYLRKSKVSNFTVQLTAYSIQDFGGHNQEFIKAVPSRTR